MFDTLLSVSALPLFFSSYNSWSTSLNLLFFYITWSMLILSHSPLKIELIGSLIIRVLFFWVPALLFLLFDIGLPALAKTIKLQGARGLRSEARAAHRAKVVGWALLNTVLAVAVQGVIEYVFTDVVGARRALKVSSKLPLPGELMWGVFRGVLVREVRGFFVL
jgi:hypothetical protein